jgi:hypothetical protein
LVIVFERVFSRQALGNFSQKITQPLRHFPLRLRLSSAQTAQPAKPLRL